MCDVPALFQHALSSLKPLPPSPPGWASLADWGGDLSPRPLPGGAEAIAASSWVYHPSYSSARYTNDVGLVTLSMPSNFSSVYLDLSNSSGFAAVGNAAVALGFGSTAPNSGDPADLTVAIPSQLNVRGGWGGMMNACALRVSPELVREGSLPLLQHTVFILPVPACC